MKKYEVGLQDHEPRVVTGVRWVHITKARDFSRKFKNAEAMATWLARDENSELEIHTIERVNQ